MIVKRLWGVRRTGGFISPHGKREIDRVGFFLFGFIPLYVADLAVRYKD